MNKVFKVIWSEARNAYVVVSEIAKNHGSKSCSTKKLLTMLIATGVMTCASVAPAMAANPAPNDTQIAVGKDAKAKGGDSVAIGNGAEAKAANGIAIGYKSLSGDRGWGVAVGGKTQAIGTYGVALGQTAKVLEYEGIAIGHTSLSEGSGAIAIGKSTNAKGAASLAFGNDAKALEEASIAFGQGSNSNGNASIAIGRKANATGKNSIAIGNQAVAAKENSVVIGAHTYNKTTGTGVTGVGQQTQVLGDYSTAFGMLASANKSFTSAIGSSAKATADCANAFGSNSTASAAWSVALGTNSVADRTSDYVGLYAPEDTNSLTWRANGGAVSVGSNGTLTRQITNVAAGTEATDAVNVAQLKAATENAGWNLSTNGVATEATNVKPGDFVDFSGDKNISVSHDGTKVKVELNKDIDVNYVQTNALNAKYNLSVGTANADGTMPFFVNSTGAFYAANNKFSVDKDGKVTATAGEIGNVVLQNGVYTGHSALRDGELFVGDASGNYSQITTKGAKLGKVTVDKAGQIHNVTAGTADEDAVNVSQLNKATASSKTTVSNGTNTTVTSTVAEDGHTDYKVNLNKELEGIESISNGDAKINLNDTGVVISKGNDKTFSITDTGMGMSVIGDDYVERSIMVGKTGTVISGGLSVAGSKITNVAAGTDDTDAVNYGQLKKAVSEGNTDSHIKAGEYEVGADNKVSMDIVDKNGQSTGEKVTIKDVAKASDVGDVSKIDKDIQNKEGNTTVVNAVNNVNNKVGDLKYSQVAKDDLVDGDNTTTAIGKLNQKLSDVEKTAGAHSTVSTDDSGNISVTPTKDEKTGATDYKVSLNKDLKLDSVKVGENVSLTKDGLTAGDTKVTNAGLSIGDKTYVSKDGLNANNQTITNVADGKVEKGSTDAVNGGQLYETNQAIANNATNISSLSHSISNLDNRVNKVGAGAAALAALHPLDFDPDAKWDFAAGYGNYRGANAAAVGAYYRPNEDTMFSVGGTFGNGENMVNAGVSFKLGSGSSHVSTSRVAMAKEIKELRGELEAMKSAMLDANAGKKIDTSKLQLFPDVPQNHWAYEYVAQLAGNGMIEGYPDGNFAGDRPMTRYEFAAILYRAMTKGAVLSDKILSEFSHELEYFTVDTIAKDKAGNPTIQRVRTVKENKNK